MPNYISSNADLSSLGSPRNPNLRWRKREEHLSCSCLYFTWRPSILCPHRGLGEKLEKFLLLFHFPWPSLDSRFVICRSWRWNPNNRRRSLSIRIPSFRPSRPRFFYFFEVSAGTFALNMTPSATGSLGSGPRYAPEDPTLPKPWKGLVDGSTGYLYYWNPATNVTQYERPSAEEQLPPPPPLPKFSPLSSVQVHQHHHEEDGRSRSHQVLSTWISDL